LPNELQNDKVNVVDNQIWTPTFPSSEITSMSSAPTEPPDQIFILHLAINLGGYKDLPFSKLRRIVAIMYAGRAFFLGFEFIYDDGSHSFYGTRTIRDYDRKFNCIELSFIIDGAGGETVSSVEVIHCLSGKGVRSIQV
jgi:hypothetical protein